SLAELKALNKQVTTCWRNVLPLVGMGNSATPSDKIDDPGQIPGAATPPTSGYAGDTAGDGCKPDDYGIYRNNLWYATSSDSSIKSQGNRGSCVAFGIVGAMEASLYRNYNKQVNLSEQALYAKVKLEWEPDDLGDGISLIDTVSHIHDEAFNVPVEKIWTYN